MNKVVIADAGPLIAFSRLRSLELLPGIFEAVLVTPAVLEECAGRGDFPESALILGAAENRILQVCAAPDFSVLARDVDAGEASAIALALERECGVLMDDKGGRRMATNVGIPAIGTVGVLVLAKRKGLVPFIKPLLDELSASGYFLGTAIIDAALAAGGE